MPFDYEDNSLSGGWLDTLVNAAGRGADIYRQINQPAPAQPATSPARTVVTPVGNFSPWAIGGAVGALVVVLWLLVRGK